MYLVGLDEVGIAMEESADWSYAYRTSEEGRKVEEESPALMCQLCITMSRTLTDTRQVQHQLGTSLTTRERLACS